MTLREKSISSTPLYSHLVLGVVVVTVVVVVVVIVARAITITTDTTDNGRNNCTNKHDCVST